VTDYRFVPLAVWPHGDTLDRRGRSTFRAGWEETLSLLDRELRLLDASNVLIGVALAPGHIRQDGRPRANAPTPTHPGAEVSFDSGSIARLDPLVRRGHAILRRFNGDEARALKGTHPDVGGDPAEFVALQAALDPGHRLVYATDACDFWQHNVRSIALGLAALRAVDRYGISRRGEQYAGYRAALTARAAT
jgi:hypothetical protein